MQGRFAIVLCLLLIVCKVDLAAQNEWESSGNSIFSTILEMIIKQWDFFVKESLSHKTALEKHNNEATGYATHYNEVVENTLESAIAQWKKEMAELTESAQDVSSCIASTIDMQKIAEELRSDVSSCIGKSLNDLNKEYEATRDAIEKFTYKVQEIRKQAESCSGDMWASITCIVKIWQQVSGGTVSEGKNLWAKAASLTSAFNNFQMSLTSCGFPTAVETLANEAEEARTRIKECIEEIESPRYLK